ncbi:FAD-binding oxidoreductase [Mesorhizobium sp. J428]|uniref:NAD(P)/FAD-dependent oxidoreductase n=1 Tax=Mesorhizobium sp. J428 TaxID=2898440 RepID=UPI002150AB9F|nr:FAD-dependent oxidoreductase [Mesorhizobium sp. J428]MCR5855932.1 FAD-binding oxidoreductase [Mesorhizobium sp. J428]
MIRKLDLRTGNPVWTAYRAPRIPSTRLTRDIRTDVLVVGMGISGAMIAEALSCDGHDVVVIDRRGPMKGSTAATTALVQYEIDQPLTRLTRMIGKGKAEAAWRRSRLAIANLSGHLDELGIRCDKHPRPSLLLAGTVLGAEGLRAEAEARRAAGIAAEYLTRGELRGRFGIDRAGAILSLDNLAVDPRKMTAGFHLAVQRRGARYHSPVEATTFSFSQSGVEVGTREGPVISTRHVVLATGYELASIAPPKGHRVVSTWAIATKPQRSALWPSEAFIWEASDPYLYMRALPDGRVICGGEDEDFQDEAARDALIDKKTALISRKLGRLLPYLDPTPEFAWTGSFGTTATGLPIIAKVPRHPRIHAVMGYGGNGITFSRMATEMIRTDLAGGRDADAALFAFPE